MEIYLFLLIAVVSTVNLWHAFLLVRYKNTPRPESISEHAVATTKLLITHRWIHSIASMMFVVYAFSFLRPQELALPIIALLLGAFFDVIEVWTLTVKNSSSPVDLEIHQSSAWLMVVSYLIYGIFIGTAAGFSTLFINAVWALFAMLIIIEMILKYRYFWVAQMIYFVSLSAYLIVAHINLIRI